MDTYLDENGKFDTQLWAAWAQKRGFLPWQMTLAEYGRFLDRERVPLAELASHLSNRAIALIELERLSLKRCQLDCHKRSVEQAFQAGKAVRQEVLADYNLQWPIVEPL